MMPHWWRREGFDSPREGRPWPWSCLRCGARVTSYFKPGVSQIGEAAYVTHMVGRGIQTEIEAIRPGEGEFLALWADCDRELVYRIMHS